MQTIFRSEITSKFTHLPNEMLNDKRLSLEARGLMAMMSSYPDTTKIDANWIQSRSKESMKEIQAALNELEKFEYIKL